MLIKMHHLFQNAELRTHKIKKWSLKVSDVITKT